MGENKMAEKWLEKCIEHTLKYKAGMTRESVESMEKFIIGFYIGHLSDEEQKENIKQFYKCTYPYFNDKAFRSRKPYESVSTVNRIQRTTV